MSVVQDRPKCITDLLASRKERQIYDLHELRSKLDEIRELPVEEREAAAVWLIRSIHGCLRELERIESLQRDWLERDAA